MSRISTLASATWSELRYATLLPLTRRDRRSGRLYARLVGRVEYARDAGRRRTAVGRIARALGLPAAAATAVFRDSLVSEAQEEADTIYFMHRPESTLRAAFIDDARAGSERGTSAAAGESPARVGAAPAVYATLHFGSPILCYLYLRLMRDVSVHLIGRKLDATNPMPGAKRAYGVRKVAWVERLSARPFVDVDGASMARMRERLLDGESAFAAVDVPGDVVARRTTTELFGERVTLSAGIATLAKLARVPVQPIVAISEPAGIRVHYGEPIEAGSDDAIGRALGERMTALIARWPAQWWMWPYLSRADG